MSDLPRSARLLPANATALERALSDAAGMQHNPEVLATLWDAATCPVQLLPWLAWALSVDEWDEAWPEARKRQAVLQSVQLHRKKGTPWAVLRALEVRGYPGCELIEFKGYQDQWREAGGLFMDGSFAMDGRFMAAHLSAAGSVMRGAVINHWAQYAIRVNAAEEYWSRTAQRAIMQTARRYAPVRSHLVALIGFMRWGHFMSLCMRPARQRLRVTFKGCTRLTSVRMPTMDGCWLMDADKHTPDMSGAWAMDGSYCMAAFYRGQTMEGGQLGIKTRLRVRLRMSMGGQTQHIHRMDAAPVLMDGRLRMDRHTMTGWPMAGSDMAAAQMDRLGLRLMNGLFDMGATRTHTAISMRATATLRSKGQVFQEVLA